jgi:LacI family transcriptional regulator
MSKRNKSRVTLEDVARHAGVSRATASLVARNSTLIAEKTRQKVLRSMKELGYVYDRIASNLRSRSSYIVGVIITEIANPYFSELLAGVHQKLDRDGYTVILGTTYGSREKQEKLISTMMENRVGGMILSPTAEFSPELVGRIREWGIPVVMFAREVSTGTEFDYIGVDNVQGGYMATEHLIGRGHRRIAYLGGTPASSAWRHRREGYRKALELHGLPQDDRLILNTPDTREGGRQGVLELFAGIEPPTALFCYNDIVALGAMQGLRQMGLEPGRDVAVIGFDNIPETEQTFPRLTTISAFPKKIGMMAAELLHERMNGLDRQPFRQIIAPELVVRESTG